MVPQNVIAICFDCDGTSNKGNMQDVLLKEFNVDDNKFWGEVNQFQQELIGRGFDCDRTNAYMIKMIEFAQNGTFLGLSNKKLKELGRKIPLFPGKKEFLLREKEIIKSNPLYRAHGIVLEGYYISAGLKQMILGSDLCLSGAADGVFASEFSEINGVIAQVARAVGHMNKTEFLHMINKGANKNSEINVNDVVPRELRRVPWEQMIVVGDSHLDVPMFATVSKRGGSSYAVYDPLDNNAFKRADELNRQGRVITYGPADYAEESHMTKVLRSRIHSIADSIVKRGQERIKKDILHVPHYH